MALIGNHPRLFVVLTALVMVLAMACGRTTEVEVERIVEVPVSGTPTIIEREVIVEVPVSGTPTIIEREVIREVIVTAPTATPRPTSTPTPAGQIKRGGILTEPRVGNISLDPGHAFLTIMYSNLIYNSRGDEIACDLCETWETSADGKTLTFHLRRGVKFHDGSDFTAADVKYSLAKIQGLVTGVPEPNIAVLVNYIDHTKGDATYSQDGVTKDGITTPDPYTVELHLLRPSAFVVRMLITPSALIIKEGATIEELQLKPNGTGPFMFKDVQLGSFLEVERNPNYYMMGADGKPLPYLDGMKILVITDESVILANFLTGRLDFASTLQPVSRTFLPALDNLEEDGEIQHAYIGPFQSPVGLLFNVNRPPFDNKLVRQAVNLAVDRRAFSAALHDGRSLVGLPLSFSNFARPESEIWNVLPGWGEGAKKAEEIEQAKQLLSEAGFPDGIDGVELMPANFSGTIKMGEFFAAELAKIGIKASLDIVDFAVWFPRIATGDFDATPMWWTLSTNDPDEAWGNDWVTGASRNSMGYSNPEFDRLYELQSRELDFQKRLEINRQMEDILLEDMPVINAMAPRTDILLRSYVKGHEFVKMPVVIGHSLGGAIAIQLASQHPVLPVAIIGIDSPVLMPQQLADEFKSVAESLRGPNYLEAALQAFDRMFIPTDNQQRKAQIVESMSLAPQHVMASALEEFLSWDGAAALSACKVPTLLINSGRAVEDVNRYREFCPQLIFGQTVGTGHFIQLEAPGQVNAMIERFISTSILHPTATV